MKKTILFLLYRECTFLPPFMTILDSLCEDYTLKVISCETTEGRTRLESQYKDRDVNFISREGKTNNLSLINRLKRRIGIKSELTKAFKKEAERLVVNTPHDLLWVIHEHTVFEFNKFLKSMRFVVSFYELNDHQMDFLEKIKSVTRKAREVIVPEYSRACILRTWLGLETTPTVVPNKPLGHPRKRNIQNIYTPQLENKKILLYQGYIVKSRSIDKICEAVKEIPDYYIVLMGKGDQVYIDELKKRYPHIIYIEFIAPPEHLFVTSYAHIAIVKYDFVYLNAIFCAPNKTWEYTGFGIPVLCHDIPGLHYTIGQYKAGICTDLDDIEKIKKAICEIDDHYSEYSNNAVKYYESVDVKKEIFNIVNRNIL